MSAQNMASEGRRKLGNIGDEPLEGKDMRVRY